MKLYVYHAKTPSFLGFRTGQKVSLFDLHNLFEAVATIEMPEVADVDALEDAFRLTNHIDDPWWENEGVTLTKESRSTSVGDVIVVERGDTSEAIYGVSPVGFSTLRF